MKEPKRNLVKDEFTSSVYINIDEYLGLVHEAIKLKKDFDAVRDRLEYVSESKAGNEIGKLFKDGFIDGIENNKLEELKEVK
jgi:hypothetical protein